MLGNPPGFQMAPKVDSDSKFIKVAIDGPSASGKSTTARRLASKHSFRYVDSGAIYRAVTLVASLCGWLDPIQLPSILAIFPRFNLEMGVPDPATLEVAVQLNGNDISTLIRSARIDQQVGKIASIPEVREQVKRVQQRLIEPDENSGNSFAGVVMDGRDIGSCVMPDAQVKIFLEADAATRARRRVEQQGGEFEKVLAALKERDLADESREHSPLIRMPDAHVLDNSNLAFDQQVSIIDQLIQKAKADANIWAH